jgi:hypothetical protein
MNIAVQLLKEVSGTPFVKTLVFKIWKTSPEDLDQALKEGADDSDENSFSTNDVGLL